MKPKASTRQEGALPWSHIPSPPPDFSKSLTALESRKLGPLSMHALVGRVVVFQEVGVGLAGELYFCILKLYPSSRNWVQEVRTGIRQKTGGFLMS